MGTEFYAIYKDATKSDLQTKTELIKFNEARFDPIETPVKRLRLNVYNSTTSQPGELRGLEFIDV